MFARGARPALHAARVATQQQKAGMATLKEIDQRCVWFEMELELELDGMGWDEEGMSACWSSCACAGGS